MTSETALTIPQPMTLRLVRGRRAQREIPVATVNQASAWWCRYRDERGLSANAAPRVELLVAGVVRGYISYNGKVWEGSARDWKPGAIPVFDPAREAAS